MSHRHVNNCFGRRGPRCHWRRVPHCRRRRGSHAATTQDTAFNANAVHGGAGACGVCACSTRPRVGQCSAQASGAGTCGARACSIRARGARVVGAFLPHFVAPEPPGRRGPALCPGGGLQPWQRTWATGGRAVQSAVSRHGATAMPVQVTRRPEWCPQSHWCQVGPRCQAWPLGPGMAVFMLQTQPDGQCHSLTWWWSKPHNSLLTRTPKVFWRCFGARAETAVSQAGVERQVFIEHAWRVRLDRMRTWRNERLARWAKSSWSDLSGESVHF